VSEEATDGFTEQVAVGVDDVLAVLEKRYTAAVLPREDLQARCDGSSKAMRVREDSSPRVTSRAMPRKTDTDSASPSAAVSGMGQSHARTT
jgi:hypothetical protein